MTKKKRKAEPVIIPDAVRDVFRVIGARSGSSMTAKQRSERARKAAVARWKKRAG